jgi:hypothetical protein
MLSTGGFTGTTLVAGPVATEVAFVGEALAPGADALSPPGSG